MCLITPAYVLCHFRRWVIMALHNFLQSVILSIRRWHGFVTSYGLTASAKSSCWRWMQTWTATQKLVRHHQRVNRHDNTRTPKSYHQQIILEEVVGFFYHYVPLMVETIKGLMSHWFVIIPPFPSFIHSHKFIR